MQLVAAWLCFSMIIILLAEPFKRTQIVFFQKLISLGVKIDVKMIQSIQSWMDS